MAPNSDEEINCCCPSYFCHCTNGRLAVTKLVRRSRDLGIECTIANDVCELVHQIYFPPEEKNRAFSPLVSHNIFIEKASGREHKLIIETTAMQPG